jgi:4-amino-4-deoxy-L-arabinose transferase-like glycosyltransferase
MIHRDWMKPALIPVLRELPPLPEWVCKLWQVGLVWLAIAGIDRLWFRLDRSMPAWDQADYLAGVLNHWQALQQPQWFSGDWWTGLWQLSSKIPPLVYLVTAPILNLTGPGADQSSLVMLGFSAVLFASVYTIGACLFTVPVGIWAVGLTALMPGLYRLRLEFLLDYPLAAIVSLNFACLTLWRYQAPPRRSRLLTLGCGASLGLAMLVKQTALLFLLVPWLWAIGGTLRQRAWRKLAQLAMALVIAVLIMLPWYRVNWLTVLTAGKRATIDSAIAEGDPSLLSLDAWTFYLRQIPTLVSLPLLLVPLLGFTLFWRRSRISSQWAGLDYAPKPRRYQQQVFEQSWRPLIWLLGFCLGAYLLTSLNLNKDLRYLAPLLPGLAVLLAYGLTLFPYSYRAWRWGSLTIAALLMLLQLFPLPGGNRAAAAGLAQHPVYTGVEYPHAALVAEVARVQPYLRSTIGVLPSTPEVNQHNLNYYGMLQDFQVYGRQVGTRKAQVTADARSLAWFVTKTGKQGAIRNSEAQTALIKRVEQGEQLQFHRSWNLPNGDALNLYRQRVPAIEVTPIAAAQPTEPLVQLEQVLVPDRAPPGQPIPVTYQWRGAWEMLQSGLVLLTWRRQGEPLQGVDRWIHDHGIGMGNLHARSMPPTANFRVLERTAMLPPPNAAAGTYFLEASYVNRKTGNPMTIPFPVAQLQIDPAAPPTAAPELDFVTQLRSLATTLPQGIPALDRVFNEVARLSQYDPTQDAVTQTRQALEVRLRQTPNNLEFAYGAALANILKRRVDPAIATLQRVVQLDAKNPYGYAYLAFVNLYAFRPQPAQAAIDTALQLDPSIPELQALRGAAALMRGQIGQAWQGVQAYRAQIARAKN